MTSISNVKPDVSKEVEAGAAIYSKFVLSVYDIEVLFFEIPFIFKCPLKTLKGFYAKHVTDDHLEVGVGTGYFPYKLLAEKNNKNLHLLDLNKNSLEKTSSRLRKFYPTCHLHNVFDVLPDKFPKFKSIAIMNFLHCLPGTMLEKESVICNLKAALQDGGTIFGVTALGEGVDGGVLYRAVNKFHNKKGIFTNLRDNKEDLEAILKNNFKTYSVKTIGTYALFYAHD